MSESEKEDPNSPERIEALRRSIQEFRRAIGTGELDGDVIRATEPTSPAPPPDRRPLRKLKRPPDADAR